MTPELNPSTTAELITKLRDKDQARALTKDETVELYNIIANVLEGYMAALKTRDVKLKTALEVAQRVMTKLVGTLAA
ncbi:MAG: hypothetical protein WB902_04775 [Acetobacteraceae bacterium]|jgi:hypothetical protein